MGRELMGQRPRKPFHSPPALTSADFPSAYQNVVWLLIIGFIISSGTSSSMMVASLVELAGLFSVFIIKFLTLPTKNDA